VGGYLRFLKSFVPSISVTYSNPFSMRLVASSTLVAVLQWYASFSRVSLSACSVVSFLGLCVRVGF